MRLVIALGGNAILQRKEPMEEKIQRKNIANACELIAKVARIHDVVITHGNGPQVGLLALQNEAYKGVSPYPLDVLGAETEGMIGYLLCQELKNRSPHKEVIALLTQTLVDKDDPAFQNPSKFVGPIYTKEQADKISKEKNWVIKADGEYFRRVVSSPMPKAIIEEPTINHLLGRENIIIICAGGGGVPVMRNEQNKLIGLEAVIDKDRASNVLAQAINADAFIMLTDVESVQTNFNQPNSKAIKKAAPEQIMRFHFAEGSMGPKVEAACDFVRSGGQYAAIGALSELENIITGASGTHILKDCDEIEFY